MYINRHLIGVVLHQMVTRGYNEQEMPFFNMFIAEEDGTIIERIESEMHCVVYGGLPCCPYCCDVGHDGHIEHSPRCFFDGVCKSCGNGCSCSE